MIENSIRRYAMLSTELKLLIGNNFYLTTKHNTKSNYVLLRIISDNPDLDLHMDEGQNDATVQFDCYSKDPLTASEIAKTIDSVFNTVSFKDTLIKVQFALKQNRIPSYDEDAKKYRVSLDYAFYYNTISNGA